MDRCNKLEGGGRFYTAVMTTLHLYDGRKVEGQIYTRSIDKLENLGLPSKRYLHLIINGAKEAGLDAEYVKKLEAQTYYTPTEETIAKRKNIPAPESLPKMSYTELTEQVEEDGEVHFFISILGYVLKVPKKDSFFDSHRGRDITARQLRHLRGVQADMGENDDKGRPPYPNEKTMDPDEYDYLWQWLDYYTIAKLKEDYTKVVGFIAEWDQKIE